MKRWTKEEQKAHRQELTAALRSGKYVQAMGRLRRDYGRTGRQGDSYCCLGIACDISGVGSWGKTEENTHVYGVHNGIFNSASYMPRPVADYYGFVNQDGVYDTGSLVSLNDAGAAFKQIADLIDQEPSGLVME